MALVSSSRASQVFSESIQTDYSSLEHENYTNFVSVLKLPFKEKTIENFQRVLLFANSLDFFKNLNEKHGEDATFMCCRYMYFSEYKPQMNICNLNEPCKSIFVLLNGTVNEISEIQINELKKGHKFGDSDCLKPISYQSKTKCSVGAIDISDYK